MMSRVAAVVLVACTAMVAACSDDDDEPSGGSSTEAAMAAAVRVEALGCKTKASLGAGSFVADERVITVAHVVAGADSVVVVLADGRRVDATVVAIDRLKDLAVLHVEEDVEELPRATMRAGAEGNFVVYREDKPLLLPFEAISFVDIKAPDIDHGGTSLRRGYQLDAEVEKGDSGTVLVIDGEATGVIFARSTSTGGKAWAVDISEADELLAGDGEEPVDVGECV